MCIIFTCVWGGGGWNIKSRFKGVSEYIKCHCNIPACSPGRFLLCPASDSGTRALSMGDSA